MSIFLKFCDPDKLDEGKVRENQIVTVGSGEFEVEACMKVDNQWGYVHADKPGVETRDDHAALKGKTYPAKEDIKKLPYGEEGTMWDGDNWVVHLGRLHDLVGALVQEGHIVTVDAKSARKCKGMREITHEVDIGEEESETLRFVCGPVGGDSRVSTSWAKIHAEKAGMNDYEEYAEKMGYDIFPDEELMEIFNVDDIDNSPNMLSTDEAL